MAHKLCCVAVSMQYPWCICIYYETRWCVKMLLTLLFALLLNFSRPRRLYLSSTTKPHRLFYEVNRQFTFPCPLFKLNFLTKLSERQCKQAFLSSQGYLKYWRNKYFEWNLELVKFLLKSSCSSDGHWKWWWVTSYSFSGWLMGNSCTTVPLYWQRWDVKHTGG